MESRNSELKPGYKMIKNSTVVGKRLVSTSSVMKTTSNTKSRFKNNLGRILCEGLAVQIGGEMFTTTEVRESSRPTVLPRNNLALRLPASCPRLTCVLRPLCPRLARVRPAFGPHDARVLRPRCPRAACVLRLPKLRLAGRSLRSILGKTKNIVEIRFTLTEQVSLFVHPTAFF